MIELKRIVSRKEKILTPAEAKGQEGMQEVNTGTINEKALLA